MVSFNFVFVFKCIEDVLCGVIVFVVVEDVFNIYRGLIYCVCFDWWVGVWDYGVVEVGVGWIFWWIRIRFVFGVIGDW